MMPKIVQLFQSHFHSVPRLFRAPGRINLIGEHTDYNDGFVMPTAIDKSIHFAIAPNGTSMINSYAATPHEKISFDRNELKPGQQWQNYLMGVIDGFARRNKIVGGVDCVFDSDVPMGAGLSSSAAICSGFGFALNELFQFHLSRLELATIAQESEHRFAGVKVGIMDMYASLFSQCNSVLLLDCRSFTHQHIPISLGDYEFLLIDTKVKHTLASSAYNQRRASCEHGVSVLQKYFPHVKSLRDATADRLQKVKSEVTDEVFLRCNFIVNEIDRTQKASVLLKENDLIGFGKLMYDTHWGLSREYEVSCAESDWLVRAAQANNVTGARQMGGGFGGCTINLIHKTQRADFEEYIREKYFSTFNSEAAVYSVRLTNGVEEVSVG